MMKLDISVERDTQGKSSDLNQDLGLQILAELKSLSGQMQQVEDKVKQQEATEESAGSASQPPLAAAKPPAEDTILPYFTYSLYP